jgi:ABC-2 type transport system permease protein
MLLHSVFLKTLRDLRLPTLLTGIGVGILGFYFLWLFPTFSGMGGLQQMMDQMPPAVTALIGGSLIDMSTPVGWLNIELFPLMLPLILSGYAIALGSGATASEEASGSLDWLLSGPVPRWRVVVEKSGAIVIGTALVAAALFLGVMIGATVAAVNVPADRVASGLVSGTLLALAFGGMALALACATGSRGIAIGLVGAILVVTYFVNSLAPLVDGLDRIQGLSPFYYYIEGDPLRNGLDLARAGVLTIVAVAGFLVAIVAFERRDLSS